MKSEDAIHEIIQEYDRATRLNGAFPNAHCGYAVILEELDELWHEIRKCRGDRDPERMREEATQVAAMALRFLVDLL